MAARRYLAFDLGASSGRAIIGTLENGKLSLEEVHRFENGPFEKDGSLFWNFDGLFGELKTGLKKAVATAPDIASMAIDTWGVDYGIVKEDGSFARPPYHYRDSRTDKTQEAIFGIIPEVELYAKTGIQRLPFNTIYQLFEHKKAHPEDFKGGKVLLMPDALAYRFCGEVSCEYTDASTMQLLDAKKRDWDFDLIERVGLPKGIFPKVQQPCAVVGKLFPELAKELGCASIAVCKIGSHDTASAVASVPAPKDVKWAYISCGTWALLGSEADAPTLTPEAMRAGFTNEGGINGKIRFLSNIIGLWLVQETRRIWSERKGSKIPFAEIAAMAEKAQPLRYLVNPNDPRFMAPGDIPAKIREYCAETKQQGVPDDAALVRCIYDSLALCFRSKLEQLQSLTGVKYGCMNIVGGGTQAKILMRLAADCLGIPVVAGPVEATAIGNILSQAMAEGKVKSLEEAREIVRSSFEVDEYQPSKSDRKAWDDAYSRFVKLP